MHSDQSVRHIALTCPHCGKHYKKVPYDAIKKHQFAFCKECNTKFRVEPSLLEEALNKATLALAGQGIGVSTSISQQTEHTIAPAGEHESASDRTAQIQNMQSIPGLENIVQQAAEAARDLLPQPPSVKPHDDSMVSQLFNTQNIETKEQPVIAGSFEQKINILAAKIEETFGQPQETIPSDNTDEEPVENIFGQTLIDTTQGDYPTLSSAGNIQESKDIPFEKLIEYQSHEAAVEKVSEPEIHEASVSQDQPSDTSLETNADQTIFTETQLKDQFIAAFRENAFYDDTLEKILIDDQAIDVSPETIADQTIFTEPPLEEQFIPISPEPAFYDDTLEKILIDDQAIDVSPETIADQTIFTEPPLEEQFIAASTETGFNEESIDGCLIEEQSPEQSEQYPENNIGAQEKNPAFARTREQRDLTTDDFLASRSDTGGNREMSAMLKDLVLPTSDIEEGTEQFVLFSLGDQTFAAPIANVFELSLPPDVIMVPNTPPWMLGVANMRGEILSIVDLMGFLNMGQENIRKPSRMIIAQTNDRQMMLGLIVDRINGIKYFTADEILPVQQNEPGQTIAYLNGALVHEDAMVAVFDFEKMLQSSKMRQFQ